jgi:hypothetical protein
MKKCQKCGHLKAEDQFDKRKRPGRFLAAGKEVPLKKLCRACCQEMSETFLALIADARRAAG